MMCPARASRSACLLADLRVAGDRDAKARDRLTLRQDSVADRGVFPFADQGQREKLTRPQRPEREIVEPLLVLGQHDRPAFEIDARDLIEVDDREHRPQRIGGHSTVGCSRKYGMLVSAAATANQRSHSMSRTEYETSSKMFEKCTR
jgi:hypothetical protein